MSQTPAGTGFTAVAAGFRHSVALRADGSIVSWGLYMHGEVSQTPTDAGYTAIAAGLSHNVALRRDGSIVSWGSDDAGEVSQTPMDAGYTAIAAGGYHSLALRRNGSIASWGSDTFGQVSRTPAGAGLAAVAAGDYYSLALHIPAPAIDLEANVSVDGGATWLDADTAPGPDCGSGFLPQFRFMVTNIGNVDLSNVVFSDGVYGAIVLGSIGVGGAESIGRIAAPWQQGQYTNVATVNGSFTDDAGTTASASDSDAGNYFGIGPSIRAVPPGTALPTDTNSDGLYDDVNGNGREDFADVVLFFNQMSWIATNEPMAAFDCNDNDRIDFADVVWLFNNL